MTARSKATRPESGRGIPRDPSHVKTVRAGLAGSLVTCGDSRRSCHAEGVSEVPRERGPTASLLVPKTDRVVLEALRNVFELHVGEGVADERAAIRLGEPARLQIL